LNSDCSGRYKFKNLKPDFHADIQRDISHILFGGSYPWIHDKGVIVTCCTDGLRSVIFKREGIEDLSIKQRRIIT
jgi:hypothetical protein